MAFEEINTKGIVFKRDIAYKGTDYIRLVKTFQSY